MIKTNSRYAVFGYTYREARVENEPSFQLTTATREVYPTLSASNHVCVEGENFRTLARTYLGGEGFWWRIADANQDLDPVVGAFQLEPGSIVIIPLS